MDNLSPNLSEVVTQVAPLAEKPKSAWEVAQAEGNVKVESAISKAKNFFKRIEGVGTGLLGLATSEKARDAMGNEIKGKVVDAVDAAALTVYAEVSRAEQQIKQEWSKGVHAVENAVNETVDLAKGKATEVAVAGYKKMAAFGAENVIPIVKDVINVEGQVEAIGFTLAAEVIDTFNRPIRESAAKADLALRGPESVIKGVMEGVANRPHAKNFAENFRGAVDFLGKCRDKAKDAYALGSQFRSAANEIRGTFAKRQEGRDAYNAGLDTLASDMKAGK